MTEPKSNKQKRLLLRKKAEKRKAEALKERTNQKIKEQKALDLATRLKSISRHPKQILDAIFAGEFTNKYVPPIFGLSHISQLYQKSCHSHYPKEVSEILYRILVHCFSLEVNFFDVAMGGERADVSNALLHITARKKDWLREPEEWKPVSHNTKKQLSSFLRHLFAKYYVPIFMDRAWYDANTTQEDWFIHIGIGQNLRTANDLPIPLTKMMAHCLLQAPNDFDINGAIRWGQMKVLGGDERNIRAVLGTKMGTNFADNGFWETVFSWFIANPMLDLNHYAPIVDYIHHQKYVPSIANPDPNGLRLIPAQPNLSMKKRTVEATLKQVEEWHKRLGNRKNLGPDHWEGSGIIPFEYIEGKGEHQVLYQTVELLSLSDLKEEGDTMHHCVGSYSTSCASGRVSVWSLQSTNYFGNKHRLLTIEVSNSNQEIRQARGKHNEFPDDKCKNLLREWCRQSGLRISRWLI